MTRRASLWNLLNLRVASCYNTPMNLGYTLALLILSIFLCFQMFPEVLLGIFLRAYSLLLDFGAWLYGMGVYQARLEDRKHNACIDRLPLDTALRWHKTHRTSLIKRYARKFYRTHHLDVLDTWYSGVYKKRGQGEDTP